MCHFFPFPLDLEQITQRNIENVFFKYMEVWKDKKTYISVVKEARLSINSQRSVVLTFLPATERKKLSVYKLIQKK